MIYTPYTEIGLQAAIKRVYFFAEMKKDITIEAAKKVRSNKQNRALHLWFKQVADLLNERAITWTILGIECRFTDVIIKDSFKQIAEALFDIDSTTKLTTNQINEIFDAYSAHLIEITGEFIEFPSIETLTKNLNKWKQ